MSRLEELIQELCPDGVEYKELGDIFNTRNGYTPSKKEKSYWENGTIPWFRMEDIRENGRILNSAIQNVSPTAIKGKLFPANSIIVATSATIGEHALITVDSLANQRFTYLTVKPDYLNRFDIKFLYYYCFNLDQFCMENLNQGNFASVDMKKFHHFKFPIPPLPVQEEIVRILDTFTELTAELTAELDARKKQYEYYRDELLSHGANEVYLDSICKIVDCPHTSPKWKATGIPVIRNYNLVNGHISNEKMSYVDKEEYKTRIKRITPQEGDILFSREAPIGNVGIIPPNYICCQGQRVVLLRASAEIVMPQFLIYALQGTYVRNQIEHVEMIGATVSNFNISDLRKLRIMIPPLAEQERIVSILDRFDTLCNDLTSGLPAEIEARKKQYEYYRDKLLTFKEKVN